MVLAVDWKPPHYVKGKAEQPQMHYMGRRRKELTSAPPPPHPTLP